ncbi:Uncharacterised protein [Legionella steigerwaltii]|uniref:Transmembrane protein n=1 Tax=Legionella steigerwaltii TaxID=460 RepID=A0A378LB02_9GAMM|nr:DUF4407 domain-containing protein [Legionella steigerwaltii]KTD70282.1 hypothetical protein Lstg_3284 [Legionella steigerwaltii]STY24016.1 Uncharacterised protein [Legionella steigerwaltii]
MRRMTAILFFALSILLDAVAPSAHAATTVQVVSTYPSSNVVTLGNKQNFYLHLYYQSDHPTRIWVKPYFHGEVVNAGSNPSRVYPAGSGEALGWFFLFKPGTQVDEVRISAGDGSFGGTSVVATYPVQVTGGNQPTTSQGNPDWVTRLDAIDTAVQKADYERRMNTPLSIGDKIMFSGFMLGILALGALGIAMPAWGLWRWRDGWRIAAAVPMALMVFVVLRLFIDVSVDPTSHNLWPFEILLTGSLSVAIMIALVIARKITGANCAS